MYLYTHTKVKRIGFVLREVLIMFGLFFFMLIGICWVMSALIKAGKDIHDMPTTSMPDKGYYRDSTGHKRSLKTGQLVSYFDDWDGQEVLMNKHGKIIRNFSEEKNLRVFNRAIEANDGHTACREQPMLKKYSHGTDSLKGNRYKDLNSLRSYVVRQFKIDGLPKEYGEYDPNFFMDTQNGHLVRLTDTDSKIEKYQAEENKAIIDRFIRDFNANQDIDIKNKDRDANFVSHFYGHGRIGHDPELDRLWELDGKEEIEYANKTM